MAKQAYQPATRRPAARATQARARAVEQSNVSFGFPWTTQNVIGIGVGVAVIVVGYLLMGTAITKDVANNDGIWNNANAVTIAPILLTIGYCVIVPFFIFKRFGSKTETSEEGAG